SELCLGGLVKHVTAGWRQWTRFIVEGPDALGGMGSWDPEQEGGGEAFAAAVEAHSNGFRMLPGETLAGLLAEFDAAAAWTVEVVSSLPDLDVSHPVPPAPWFQENAVWSARRVLLHLI